MRIPTHPRSGSLIKALLVCLERLKKYCSHAAKRMERAVFLVFGFVSAQSQGYSNLLLRQSLAKNQKSSLRIGYSIFLTALASTLLLCSCKKTPQQKIVGTWNVEGSPSVMEFHKDGTLVSTDNGKSTPGKYRFTDDSHLEMETVLNVQGTNTLQLKFNFEIVFHGDKADLTLTIPGKQGAPPVSQTLHYTRAN
jgi:hypothetical protein